jgi:alkylated DNA repair dioxygenase AlkB
MQEADEARAYILKSAFIPIYRSSIILAGRAALSEQFSLFADRLSQPEGLRYAEEFVSPTAEKTLIGHIAALPLQPFQFGQYEGKRRVVSFGFRYDYTMRRLEEADPIPEWLGSIIETVEAFGGRGTRIGQVLCTEYDVGVGIGWHRDKPHFDRVFGLSLGSACKFRFRRPAYTRWERCTRGPATFDLHDDGAVAGGLGTQHPCRRGAALLDHLPDDGSKILMARPNLCYLASRLES